MKSNYSGTHVFGPSRQRKTTCLSWAVTALRLLSCFAVAASLLLPVRTANAAGGGVLQAAKYDTGSTLGAPLDSAVHVSAITGDETVYLVYKSDSFSCTLRKFTVGQESSADVFYLNTVFFANTGFTPNTMVIHDIDVEQDHLFLAGTVTDATKAYCFFAKCTLDGKAVWATILSGGKAGSGTEGTQGKAIVVDTSSGGKIYGAGQHTSSAIAGNRYLYNASGVYSSTVQIAPSTVATQTGDTAKFAIFRMGADGSLEEKNVHYWKWDYAVFQNSDPKYTDTGDRSAGSVKYGDCIVEDIAFSGNRIYLSGANPTVADFTLSDHRDTSGDSSWESGDPIAAVKDNKNWGDPDHALFQHETFEWLLDDTGSDSIEGSKSNITKIGDTSWTLPLNSTLSAVVYAFDDDDLDFARADVDSQPFSYSDGPGKSNGKFNSVVFNSNTDKVYVAGYQGSASRSDGVIIRLSSALDNPTESKIRASDTDADLDNAVHRMTVDSLGNLYVAGHANQGDTDFGDLFGIGSANQKFFWGKLGQDLTWQSVTQSGSHEPSAAAREFAMNLPVGGRSLLFGYSTRSDIVFKEKVTIAGQEVEEEFKLSETINSTSNALFSVIADANGKLQRLVTLTLRANFGDDGINSDGAASVSSEAITVERVTLGSEESGLRTNSGITYRVPTGESLKVTVPQDYYLKKNNSGVLVYLDPNASRSQNDPTFEEEIRDNAKYRYTSTGYSIPETITRGTTNEYAFTMDADLTLQFHWDAFYALEIKSDFTDLGGSSPLTSQASGNPVPLADKKHWIEKNDQVTAQIDGVVPHPDPTEFLTRFAVLGYEAKGSAASDQVLDTSRADVKSLSDGVKFKAFSVGENRQQTESFTMAEPTEITYRWFTQNGVRISTTSAAASGDPEVYMDPELDLAGSPPVYNPVTFPTNLREMFPQTSPKSGSFLSWWFNGTQLGIRARGGVATSTKSPSGVLAQSGDLATASASGFGNSLSFGQFTLTNGASVTFQYGETIYKGIVDIGSPVLFSPARAVGDLTLDGTTPHVLDKRDIGKVDLRSKGFTIDFSAQRTRTSTEEFVLVHEDGDGKFLRIGFDASNHFFARMDNGGGVVEAKIAAGTDTSAYHHWAVVYDDTDSNSANHALRVYMDGGTPVSLTVAGGYTGNFEDVPLILGYSPALAMGFDGRIDNLRVWGKANVSGTSLSVPTTDRSVAANGSAFAGNTTRDGLLLIRSFDTGETFFASQSFGTGVPAGIAPAVTVLEGPPGTAPANSAKWDDKNDRLFPVRPGRFLLRWPKSQDQLGVGVTLDVNNDEHHWYFDLNTRFPLSPHYRHVVNTPPVNLDPDDADRYAFLEMPYSESARAELNQAVPSFENNDPDGTVPGQSTATSAGRTVLIFTDAGNGSIATGNEGTEDIRVRVVESRTIDIDTNLPFAQKPTVKLTTGSGAVIGTTLSNPVTGAQTTRGHAYRPLARYNANFHDRVSGLGPIIPVNREFTVTTEDDLLVVWYEKRDGIEWPAIPYDYDPLYPADSATGAKRIVIASRLGSEGVDFNQDAQPVYDPDQFDQVAIYAQNDSSLPGYNPNEEHALLAGSLLHAGEPGAALAAFALRNDLNYRNSSTAAEKASYTSDPFVLVEFRDLSTNPPTLGMNAYKVETESTSALQEKSGSGNSGTYSSVSGIYRPITLTQANHDLRNGDEVFINSVTGTGITAGRSYFVTGVVGDSFRLSEMLNGGSVEGAAPSSVRLTRRESFHSFANDSIDTTRTVITPVDYKFAVHQAIKTGEQVRVDFDRELPGFPTSGELYFATAVSGGIHVSATNGGANAITTDPTILAPVRLTAFLPFAENDFSINVVAGPPVARELVLRRSGHGLTDGQEVEVDTQSDLLLSLTTAFVEVVDADNFKLKRTPTTAPVTYDPILSADEQTLLEGQFSKPPSFDFSTFNPVKEIHVTDLIEESEITNATTVVTQEIRFPQTSPPLANGGGVTVHLNGTFPGLSDGASYVITDVEGGKFGLALPGTPTVPILFGGGAKTATAVTLVQGASNSFTVTSISSPATGQFFVEEEGHGFVNEEAVLVAPDPLDLANTSGEKYFVTGATPQGFSVKASQNGSPISTSSSISSLTISRLWPYTFNYRMRAGEPVIAPHPLPDVIGPTACVETQCEDGNPSQRTAFRDHKDQWWAVSGATRLLGRFYYPYLPNFDVTDKNLGDDVKLSEYNVGQCIPWLLDSGDFRYPDNNPNPRTVSYEVFWPDSLLLPEADRQSVPTLKAGESLTFSGGEAKGDRERSGEVNVEGLPAVLGWSAGQVVYDDENPDMDDAKVFGKYLVRLVNPLEERTVDLAFADLPDRLKPAAGNVIVDGSRLFFKELHAGLQTRIFYDTLRQKLVLRGFVNNKTLGDDSLTAAPPSLYILQPNILTLRETDALATIGGTAVWGTSVQSLFILSNDPDNVSQPYSVGLVPTLNGGAPKSQLGPGLAVFPNPALSGPASGFESGYATLAENNREELGDAPVAMHIVKVSREKFRGAVQPVFPPNIYDEKITARFTGDFGAKPDDIQFQWIYREEDGARHDPPPANAPASTFAGLGWNFFPDLTGNNGVGMNEAVFAGAGKINIQDNLIFVRWKHRAEPDTAASWSQWAGAANNFPDQGQYQAQLIDGWVKRVIRGLNPFDARFSDFRNNNAPATYASMIQQAGARHEGAIAFNPDKDVIENVGLIEAYQSVLDRASGLSIDLLSPQTGSGVNNAILMAASRVSDLYHLLGNEAYVDALNPTIGFGTSSGEYGNLAPSIFAFQNQVPSLLDEELALLRGRSQLGARPTYNRLIGNFTVGDGEVAYQMNYGIWDVNDDGFIDEADARTMYPMGHGDAWGHYTTAMKAWYTLLQHRYFTWESRAELFQLEGQVIDVDYLDERKFAKAAADRARTGAEIVNQTYRKEYVSDPDGQWQGYKDVDPNRGWGVTEWAGRAAQGALFDWAVANALLPAEAPNQGDVIGIDSVTDVSGDGQSYEIVVTDPLAANNGPNLIPYLLRVTRNGEQIGEAIFAPTDSSVSDDLVIDATSISDGATQFTVSFPASLPATGLTAADFSLAVDERPRGIRRVDRTTVNDLSEVATQALTVQSVLDNANAGLNPLGITPDIVPFDIPPADVDGYNLYHTHFDHIYARTLTALSNAETAFDYANKFSNLLRENEDSVEELTQTAIDQDIDFRNRLIEVFGMPYEGQIGAGKTYPAGYSGPDLILFMYADVTDISARTIPPPDPGFQADLRAFNLTKVTTIDGANDVGADDNNFLADDGGVLSAFFSGDFGGGFATGPGNADRYQSLTSTLESHYAQGGIRFPQSAGDFSFRAPLDWGQRLATGELQDLLMELIQADAALYSAVDSYTGHVGMMQDMMDLIEAQYDHDLKVLDANEDFKAAFQGYRAGIIIARTISSAMEQLAENTDDTLDTIKDGVVSIAGTSTDAPKTASRLPAWVVKIGLDNLYTGLKIAADLSAESLETGLDVAALEKDLEIQREDIALGLKESLAELVQAYRDENVLRVEILAAQERLRQVAGQYRATLQKGVRILDERRNLNARIAASTTESRYRDMTFRIARNDALQKYRAAFDHAARNCYMLAKVYDYETNLDPRDPASSQPLLQEIVRARNLGALNNGEPMLEGDGLSEILFRMKNNYDVLKAQLGINNPQVETGRFSLRRELFRIKDDAESDLVWQRTLEKHKVRDLWTLPEFRRYCRPPQSQGAGALPGIVIPFQSYILAGKNFFGWPLGPGDNAYDPSNFTTKARSVGVWFEDYNGTGGVTLSNTPRVYLVPAGNDVMTIPSSSDLKARVWNAVDQKLPVPLPIGSLEVNDANWIPMRDSVDGYLGEIRKYSSFRAYPMSPGAALDLGEMTTDTRLVGRSVWNTRWMLIIPGVHLLGDPDEGLSRLTSGLTIPGDSTGERDGNGISDIEIFFETFGYSGN